MPSIAGHVCFRQVIVKSRLLFLCMALVACFTLGHTLAWSQTPPAHSGPPEAAGVSAPALAYVRALQQAAREQGLASSAMWRTLLHYRVHPLARIDRSLADDRDFFLAAHGATDPEQELDATLAAFFDPTPRHALDQPAACRFIARYQWLNEQLHFDPARLPTPTCTRYRQWRTGINADKVTLIFPSAYLNSPASMYGHTFLRLDPQPPEGQASSPLLSYAVNYAANGDERDGLAYALRGLTGLYAGQFTNAPYYLRIREYNDLENRDIWEYELNLSSAEIERLLAHTWELGPTRFDYYFFDENCSYHLLSLLDAARPELALTERFTWWAIPLDTVRAVTQTPGLLRHIRYRPSNSTELQYRARLLGPAGAQQAKALAEGRAQPVALPQHEPDPQQRALILETAERLVSYQATRQASTEAATQQQRMALLSARAALPSGPPLTVPTPAIDPTQGHDTARIDLMLGRRNGRDTLLIQARPAYHDLLDPDRGYQRGAAIDFFNIELSKDAGKGLQLERFTPVAITSLSPREPLLSAKSWRVGISVQRSSETLPGGIRPLGLQLKGGPGVAYDLGATQHLLGYALLDNHAAWDRTLPHRPWAVGSGVALGLVGDLSPQWRMQAEVFGHAYLAGQPHELGAQVQLRYGLSQAWNLMAKCDGSQRQGMHVNRSCSVGVQRYW